MAHQTTEQVEMAILGAGPIGVEAAVLAGRRGWNVRVYERDEPGAHIERWNHVEFFSSWELNRSAWGEETLLESGATLEPEEAYPTGREYLERYLRPLADSEPVSGRIVTNCRVCEVARRGALKTEHVGSEERGRTPFILRLDDGGEGRFAEADIVLDATGVYRTPNGLGPGGLRAVGERENAEFIDYYIPDVRGAEREKYTDARTLVAGGGYSAVTTLRALQRLRSEAEETQIAWLRRAGSGSYPLIEDDPLPARRELSEFGNAAARGEIPEIEVVEGTIRTIEADGDEVVVRVVGDDSVERHRFDQIVANVGYRPDLELVRELQVHECWATEGPIDLAATLLSTESADCLQQDTGGVELLETPEPNFYLVGAKSYGRNSQFLLRDGFEQIRQIFDRLDSAR